MSFRGHYVCVGLRVVHQNKLDQSASFSGLHCIRVTLKLDPQPWVHILLWSRILFLVLGLQMTVTSRRVEEFCLCRVWATVSSEWTQRSACPYSPYRTWALWCQEVHICTCTNGSEKVSNVNIVVCLALKKSHQRRALCNVYSSLCVLYLLLHKVCNVFIDVVYVQLWCVWSNQREFLSCAGQMRSESCVCVPSPRECHIMGSRAWQKTPLRFVSYQSEIDLAVDSPTHNP